MSDHVKHNGPTRAMEYDPVLPTHICSECGALWRYYSSEDGDSIRHPSWNLRSGIGCKECDWGPMRSVRPLRVSDVLALREWVAERSKP